MDSILYIVHLYRKYYYVYFSMQLMYLLDYMSLDKLKHKLTYIQF